MRIALIGSAPSSIRIAPYGDTSWQIWACSPGTYPIIPRCDKFFELHKWEPGIVGKPETQVPWLSPEYCLWMSRQKCVVMTEPVSDIPGSVRLPREDLVARYGSYFFTSSLSWMMAMAIDEIQADRKKRPKDDTQTDIIGLWGVDMAATEEYGYQRAGCQFFVMLAHQLGIEITVPPESDLLRASALYGVCEHSHMHTKLLARQRELTGRLNAALQRQTQARDEQMFLQGALDDLKYTMDTWLHDDDSTTVTALRSMFTVDSVIGGSPDGEIAD